MIMDIVIGNSDRESSINKILEIIIYKLIKKV